MSTVPSIVLVDDNPGDIELVKTAFQEQGIAAGFQVASSGSEAFYLFRRLVEDPAKTFPNLLLLDLNMPGFNGFQLLGYIRTQPVLDRLRVIMLSSTCRPRDRSRALELGASTYLVKPSDWAGYAGLVDQLRPYLDLQPAGHHDQAAGPGIA
jgi:CheY-like chemotaxis protein